MTAFKTFKLALLEDDVNTAVDCFVEPDKEKYAKILPSLPSLPEYASGMKQMVMVSENEDKAKYELLSPGENGEMYSFPVSFVKDEEGNWKISQF